jgi:hypothetical protein
MYVLFCTQILFKIVDLIRYFYSVNDRDITMVRAAEGDG